MFHFRLFNRAEIPTLILATVLVVTSSLVAASSTSGEMGPHMDVNGVVSTPAPPSHGAGARAS